MCSILIVPFADIDLIVMVLSLLSLDDEIVDYIDENIADSVKVRAVWPTQSALEIFKVFHINLVTRRCYRSILFPRFFQFAASHARLNIPGIYIFDEAAQHLPNIDHKRLKSCVEYQPEGRQVFLLPFQMLVH